MALPQGPNHRWSLDFVSDAFGCGRRFRILQVVDDFTHECLALVPDTSLSGAKVFNGRLRDECMNETLFTSMAQARALLATWRQDYNNGPAPNSTGHLAQL